MLDESLTPFTQSPFVGREREVAELRAGLDDARASHGRFFFVTGEPGIGKTRLADEVAGYAASSGMAVLRAACWEGDSAPAYWPFIQVVRSALGAINQHQEAPVTPLGGRHEPRITPDLAQLVLELQGQSATTAQSARPSLDPEQARFRLFDSVAVALRNLAGSGPLMLLLEDLHDADQPSLMMLRFVVGQLKRAPILVLGTYRDIQVQRWPVLSRLIGNLVQEAAQVPLSALSREDTARMIEGRAGTPPSPRLVSDIHQATAGNPLFIDGLVRVLAVEGALKNPGRLNLGAFRVPDGVREAIRRWLALLSNRSALVIAATIGQQFDLRCLQRVTHAANHHLLDSLREASELGIVVPLAYGVYRFSHALIRNALCDELNSRERVRVHLQVGEALEEIYQPDVEAHVAELAHHFLEAGDNHKAIDYSIRAGEAAREVFAYEEAVTHWETALKLMPDSRNDRERRADLLERLGDLLALTASEGAGQLSYLERALSLYRELGLEEAAARVQGRMTISVIGEDVRVEPGMATSQRAMELSEQSGDRISWARAAVSHAFSLCASGQLARSFALVDQVTDEADRLSDNVSGGAILSVPAEMMVWLLDPGEIASRMQRELGKPRMAKAPLLRQVVAEWMRVFEILRGNLGDANPPVAQPGGEPLTEAMITFWQGEWEKAESVVARALQRAVYGGRSRRVRIYSAWLVKMRRRLGRHAAAETLLQENLALCVARPHVPFELNTRQELASLYAQIQRPEQAHPHLARCREVMAVGENWRGLAGHVARAEAMVAAAEGRFYAANGQFARAVEIYRRYQVPFEEAEALHYWGRMLLVAGNPVQALEQLDAASEFYRRHGAGEPWLDRVRTDRLRVQAIIAEHYPLAEQVAELPHADCKANDQPSEAESLAGIFRKQGEYWTLSWAGSESRLRHRKGFHYIAWLLGNPAQEFAAADLIAAVQPGEPMPGAAGARESHRTPRTIARGLGDSGAALDATAKRQYKRRLDDLREDLDLAEQLNDLGRVDGARGEIEFIKSEIAAAVGLGGRDRRSASHAERARLAVTKAIKFALKGVRQADPELGRHLSISIQTGYFCTYRPVQSVTWEF